jgi:hypothetical protein
LFDRLLKQSDNESANETIEFYSNVSSLLRSFTTRFPVELSSALPSLMNFILPLVLQRPEFVETRQFGPVTKQVDLSEAARSALIDSLTCVLKGIPINSPDPKHVQQIRSALLNTLSASLRDEFEVKIRSHSLFFEFFLAFPMSEQEFEPLADALSLTLNQKASADAVAQEIEKQQEIQKSARKAIEYIIQIEENAETRKMREEFFTFAAYRNLKEIVKSQPAEKIANGNQTVSMEV